VEEPDREASRGIERHRKARFEASRGIPLEEPAGVYPGSQLAVCRLCGVVNLASAMRRHQAGCSGGFSNRSQKHSSHEALMQQVSSPLSNYIVSASVQHANACELHSNTVLTVDAAGKQLIARELPARVCVCVCVRALRGLTPPPQSLICRAIVTIERSHLPPPSTTYLHRRADSGGNKNEPTRRPGKAASRTATILYRLLPYMDV
jgi:hypothetical protein